MAQEKPPEDLMHYEAMAQEALRGVIRSAMERAAHPSGLPGHHHFYITFKTRAPGVEGPQDLLGKYPDEMTIVLQHQYWDLEVTPEQFSVTLKFGGQPKNLVIPYAAVTRFYDPSVQFVLQFEVEDVAEEPAPSPTPPPRAGGDDDGPKVVSLDQFRKK
ncbi:ClpXP protease specificity-enhancing factor SspB [Caulobacter segnis]|uniref:SspB family protein n=1 Tax=Caulobacter segnis TaxID=88688 RepID=UPI00240F11CE|nr:ClpXP protease specificity-enhancing factor SspB [Caulobacter segnis]MDG2522762.1 ClpXP protease specificity-enhancing factor SspB [Caulobacter segnis]